MLDVVLEALELNHPKKAQNKLQLASFQTQRTHHPMFFFWTKHGGLPPTTVPKKESIQFFSHSSLSWNNWHPTTKLTSQTSTLEVSQTSSCIFSIYTRWSHNMMLGSCIDDSIEECAPHFIIHFSLSYWDKIKKDRSPQHLEAIELTLVLAVKANLIYASFIGLYTGVKLIKNDTKWSKKVFFFFVV